MLQLSNILIFLIAKRYEFCSDKDTPHSRRYPECEKGLECELQDEGSDIGICTTG